MYAHSAAGAIALLALASGAHDMTLPVLWATTTDAGGRFGGTASGFVNLASSLSGALAPMTAALLERTFGSFHGVFLAAATMYLSGAVHWLVIDPRRPAPIEKDGYEW
jgi:fucose permease